MDPRPHWLIDNPRLLVLAVALILIAGLAAWTSLPRIEDPRITTATRPSSRRCRARTPSASRPW